MKKILSLIACTLFVTVLFAQDTTIVAPPKKKPTVSLNGRSNDHFLVQFGYAGWANSPDSVSSKTAGFSKAFNVFLMFDFPFRTNPRLSMAFGPGIATDHIVFTETHVGIRDVTARIPFTDRSDTNHFHKTKIATAYAEAPIEFRYTADPFNSGNSFKAAIGVRVGALLDAHTRNTKAETRNDNSAQDGKMKEASKQFFNKTRFVATARLGYGHFTLFGSYQLNPLFEDGKGPQVKPFAIGLTLSGL
jgi:hypothetical protein